MTPPDWPEGVYSDAEALRHEAHPGRTRLDEVEPEVVEWLWDGRIPLAKITIVQGDPGLGKSFLTMDLAARVSRGLPMPDGTSGLEGPANVIMLGAEDGLADTIVPRLQAAGADLKRIVALTTPLAIPHDIEQVADAIRDEDARLVIIDPMMAFLGADTNSNNNQDTRRALAPIKAMAEELGVAVVLVHHLNKGTGPAMYRGGGSIGINAAARSVLVVAREPGNDEPDGPRILAPVKNNLGRMAPAISYRLQDVAHGVAVVRWGGITTHSAEEILAPRGPKAPNDSGALSRAEGFLADLLQGGPVAAREVKEAADANGFSWATVRRAQTLLGINATRVSVGFGGPGQWQWSLPQDAQEPTRRSCLGPEHLVAETSTTLSDDPPTVFRQQAEDPLADLADLPVEEDYPESAWWTDLPA